MMIDKINEVLGVSGVGGVKNKRGSWLDFEQESQAGREDGIAVSPFAREMANITNELNKIPEIREAKVEALKSQIEGGTYNPDLRALAQRLVWAGVTNAEN